MIFNIVGTLIGILILVFGIYYLIKDKDDSESKKIYSIVSVIGAIIIVFMIVKMTRF